MSTRNRSCPRPGLAALLVGLALIAGSSCREGSSTRASSFNAITLPTAGAHGCNGANQVFTPPQTPTTVGLSGFLLDSHSGVAAAQAEDKVYVTGAGATVAELDFTGGGAPVVTSIVGTGVIDSLLSGIGIGSPALLSGVTVLGPDTLVVVEHASNTLLLVDIGTGAVTNFVGLPSEVPGFADGVGALTRFSFTVPTQVAPSADGRLFVADPGNHALREVLFDPADPAAGSQVRTVAGTGAPGWVDGGLSTSMLDTPVGVSIACNGAVYVLESGEMGLGGHRLRSVFIGDFTFFGLLGEVTTLAGDGIRTTVEGSGALASLATPMGLASTAGGDVYWIDGFTGILRRHDSGSGDTDCPLFSDCATAMGGPANFTLGGRFSLAISATDVLYAVDADAGTLLRITP